MTAEQPVQKNHASKTAPVTPPPAVVADPATAAPAEAATPAADETSTPADDEVVVEPVSDDAETPDGVSGGLEAGSLPHKHGKGATDGESKEGTATTPTTTTPVGTGIVGGCDPAAGACDAGRHLRLDPRDFDGAGSQPAVKPPAPAPKRPAKRTSNDQK